MKYYIITGNEGFSQSFDYDNNCEYFKYKDNDKNYNINSIVIKNNIEGTHLIESCSDGVIRIFNFNSGLLLSKIIISNTNLPLYGIRLWNDDYLIVGCGEAIKIIELKNRLVIDSLTNHNNDILALKKLFIQNMENVSYLKI